MSNKASSFPAAPAIPLPHRAAGIIESGSELPINNFGDTYFVAGSRTVQSLPAMPAGTTVKLLMVGAPTFVHSAKLIMPGGTSRTYMSGDCAGFISNGDGVWRCADPYDAVVSPLRYGAAGNGNGVGGGTDDATALQRAINAAAGRILDLGGKIYRCDSTLTIPSNTVIQNGTIDFSNAAASNWLFKAEGVLGSGVTITAASRGAGSVSTASTTGVAAGKWVYLRSTSAFGQGGTNNGEFKEVKSVAVNSSISFYNRLEDLYSGTPQYFLPTLVQNIVLRDLRLIGAGAGSNHKLARFWLCRNVTCENIDATGFGERGIQFERSIDCTALNCRIRHADAAGLSYGITIGNGCLRASVIGGHYSDLRHAVTCGGEDGVDWYIVISGITATDCRDGAIDCHPQACYVSITGNSIGHLSTGGSEDGIVVQCANTTITGNTVQGASRIGILVQNLISRAGRNDDVAVVSGNQITYTDGSQTSTGIAVDCQRATGSWSFIVANNIIDNVNASVAYGIWVEITTGVGAASIRRFSITGNVVYTRRNAIALVTAANQFISGGVITGNSLETTDTTSYDVVLVSSATANFIERVNINGNMMRGGRYGINNSNGQRIGSGGNMIQGFGTTATNGTLVSTGTDYTA